ncbi:oligosaccharide flippase family protein [Rufibacter ruber]|uniref:oligosaccharide flippase family protein n=1 Tax=Rufibacter ruber TaxID=1783499 RepID=UPI00082973DC|nr:oligosaccharide flippase family protein [Rufibacter ruber]
MARKQHIQQFLKGSLWSGLSTVARAGSSLVVNKLFAIYYGPSGITLLSHFQGLIAILTTLPNSGVNVGLIRHLAQEDVGRPRYQSFFWTGLWLSLLSFVAVLATVLGFPDFFLNRFNLDALLQGSGWYPLLLVGLFLLLLLYLFGLSVLLARQFLRLYVGLVLLVSTATVAIIWMAVGELPLPAVLCLFLAGQAVGGLAAAAMVFQKRLVPAWQVKPEKETLRELGKFILMGVSTLVGAKFSDFLVREIAMHRFSLHDTGLWQTVVKVSDNYTLAYTSILGMVYYPKIAALLPREEELKKYVRTIFFTLAPLLAAGLLLVYLLRRFLLVLLFNEDFLPAQDLFNYQLLGDLFKMVAWVLSYVVAVRAQVRLYIGVQLVSPLVYFLLVLTLIPLLGIEGLTVAYAIDWALFLLFHLYLFRSYFFSK